MVLFSLLVILMLFFQESDHLIILTGLESLTIIEMIYNDLYPLEKQYFLKY